MALKTRPTNVFFGFGVLVLNHSTCIIALNFHLKGLQWETLKSFIGNSSSNNVLRYFRQKALK